MSCVLRISGKDFDVDRFLGDTGLVPYARHRKGDVMPFPKSKKIEYDDNGCSFDLSSADFDNLEQQQRDAIDFLKTNFKKFKALYSYKLYPSDSPTIDFGINSRMEDDVVVQCDYFPTELLKLAGDLGFGIEISQYRNIEQEDTEDLMH